MPSTEAGGTLITWLETLFAVPAFRRLVHAPAVGCKRAGIRACMLLAALSPAMAQAQLPPSPFPTTRSVAWDGEIMENIVLRYRWVMRYPESINRAFALVWEYWSCPVAPSLGDAFRREIEDQEHVVYLSGTNKRTETRWMEAVSSGSCAEPAALVPRHSIDIRTLERRTLYTSRGGERKVHVSESPSEIVAAMRSRAQARLRDARNPRTGIGRSMGRVWTERASFNGFDCGSTPFFGVEGVCVLLEQPRHVATNTLISVRTKPFADDPQCENPAGPEWRNPVFHLGCGMIGHRELVGFERNARISQNLFEMPAEARGLPVSRAGIPEIDEGQERD